MSILIQYLYTAAIQTKKEGQAKNNINLYMAGDYVYKLAVSLSAINDLGSDHSAITINLELGSDADQGDRVDYTIEGVSELGLSTHLASGISFGDLCDAILEIGEEVISKSS